MLHLITAFLRVENKKFYIDNLKSKKVIWHPIIYYNTDKNFVSKWPFLPNNIVFEEDWIQPYVLTYISDEENVFYHKLNSFMKNTNIVDNDRYCFMNDDDWFEDGVFEQFETKNDPPDDVCFISMKRGYGEPPGHPYCHGSFTLMVDLNRVIVGNIGLEQLCIKGRLLKTLQFENIECADGLMAIKLHAEHKVNPLYETYALFNYLEKGRWDKK